VSSREDIGQMLADIEARESKLSDWERQFVDSIGAMLGGGGSLTPKQDETLCSIWEKVTS